MRSNIFGKLSDDGRKVELCIYGDIVSESWRWGMADVSSQVVLRELENENIDQIDVFINSFGGDVFEGLAIYSILKRQKAKVNVTIDGIAASIASVIVLAGDTITMHKHSMMMIHNCWTGATGNAKELRNTADDLDKIMDSVNEVYMNRFTGGLEVLKTLLDNETLLSASECMECGFCDSVINSENKESKMQMKVIQKLAQESKRPLTTIAKEQIQGSEGSDPKDEKGSDKPQATHKNRFYKKIGGNLHV